MPIASIPGQAGRICRRLELLGPACPVEVPKSRYGLAGKPIGFDGPYAQGGYSICLDRTGGACAAEAFHLEGGVPSGNPRGDRPPRFVHLALYAARRSLASYFPFELPCTGPVVLDRGEKLLTRPRRTAACLGEEEISGRRGTLALAPPYPSGGEVGGHILFLWRDRGITYAATLHGWAPVAQAIDTLKRVVASAPMEKT